MGLPVTWKIDPKDKAARKTGLVLAVFVGNENLVIEKPTPEDDGVEQSLAAPLEVVAVPRANGWKVEAPVGK